MFFAVLCYSNPKITACKNSVEEAEDFTVS